MKGIILKLSVVFLSITFINKISAQTFVDPPNGVKTHKINSTYIVDGVYYKTIQQAINAAGSTGTVTIPSSYYGSDAYTNPSGIKILDERPNHVSTYNGQISLPFDPTSSSQVATKHYVDTNGGYFPGTVTVTGSPGNGLVLLATSGTTAAWTQLTSANLAPSFSASLSCTSNITCGNIEAGNVSTSPAGFTASYANGTPTSASLTDGTYTNTMSTPYTSASLAHTYCTVAQGIANFTFSLSAGTGTQTATANQNLYCTYRTFAGAGTSGATGVTASGSNATLTGATGTLNNASLGNQGSYTCTTTATQYCYILMTGGSHTFTSGGFAFVMNSPTAITFTNQYGVVISMYLYQSANSFFSGTTFVIQVSS